MSAAASFEFRSIAGEEEIRDHIRNLWDRVLGEGYFAGVVYWPPVGFQVSLCWFFGQPREEEQARQVIDYLFSLAADGRVHYVRDSSAYIRGSDPDYPTPISVADIFRPEFRPGMYNGIQYRYLIHKPEERASETSNKVTSGVKR